VNAKAAGESHGVARGLSVRPPWRRYRPCSPRIPM
jgi:hypothetical protein